MKEERKYSSCVEYTISLLDKVISLLDKISDEDYSRPLAVLNSSTLGKHFRHIADFYLCLIDGYDSGKMNYASRERNEITEQYPLKAIEVFGSIKEKLNFLNENERIEVIPDFHAETTDELPSVSSTIGRELMYGYDHTIHHLAMIKIGIIQELPSVEEDRKIGIAPSTILHESSH